ncbi:hypothetical protein R1sor_019842 [Riccia sorocarpa]|uniref:Uncharacterized protein n=1 Tax=Riccia sorocarpa TaxID=122646 RepID=A0ABD3IDN0_9MARC
MGLVLTSSLLAGVGCETQPAEQDAHGGTVQTANTESPENTSLDGSDPDNGVHADGEETLDASMPTTDEDLDDWLIDNEEAVTDARDPTRAPCPHPSTPSKISKTTLTNIGGRTLLRRLGQLQLQILLVRRLRGLGAGKPFRENWYDRDLDFWKLLACDEE